MIIIQLHKLQDTFAGQGNDMSMGKKLGNYTKQNIYCEKERSKE